MTEENNRYVQKSSFTYKNVEVEIQEWGVKKDDVINPKGISSLSSRHLCAYLLFLKRRLPKIVKKMVVPTRINSITNRKMPEYHRLECRGFELPGGITFYEKLYNQEGKVVGYKIGCDYQHIWNTGFETVERASKDMKMAVDKLLKLLTE